MYLRVRDEDLGRVRGQPIKPVLAGFGKPVTDWLFQSAFEAQPGESAFALRADKDWPFGEGWLLVYALRWLGPARRLAAPDALAGVFCGGGSEPQLLNAVELTPLLKRAEDAGHSTPPAPDQLPDLTAARRLVQQVLRERVAGRGPAAQTTAGLSLLMVARIVG